MVSDMKTAGDIIEALGGATAVARKIGSPITTVHGWKRSGVVPAWRIPALVTLAKKSGTPLTRADFPPPAPRKSPAPAVEVAA